MVMSLLESLYKSLYKNVKDPALSIFRSPWRPEKSCVFAATVLDPSDTQRQTRTGRPFSVLYRTRPAAFCPYPGGLNFGQIGSASPILSSHSLLASVVCAAAPRSISPPSPISISDLDLGNTGREFSKRFDFSKLATERNGGAASSLEDADANVAREVAGSTLRATTHPWPPTMINNDT